MNSKRIDVLPAPKSPDLVEAKVYYHVMMAPSIIERLKLTAHHRGYKPGAFLEELLDSVLPTKVRRRAAKTVRANIKLIRSKESR